MLYEILVAKLNIFRDISLTFPSHVFFQQKHVRGQRSLYNIFKAYAVYDRNVGYVQVCFFILYLTVEDGYLGSSPFLSKVEKNKIILNSPTF